MLNRGRYPAPGGIITTEEYTLLQGVYSAVEDTLLQGHTNSILGRIPCSTRKYTQFRGGYPAQGGILNTGEETLLQGVYSIHGRIPCSRGYTQYRGGYPAP